MRRREFALAREADVTVTGGTSECALLRAEGIAHAFDFPVIEPLPPAPLAGWHDRGGIVFLGNYAHAPNVDAAQWLCEAIMPIVRRQPSGRPFNVAGADPTGRCAHSRGTHVEVAGYVADAAALLARARVFAVPLRFGAGTKGKTVYALAAGIPVVSTTVGAEDVFSAGEYDDTPDDPERFAARIVEVYEDRARWERLSAAGRTIAARFTPAPPARLDERSPPWERTLSGLQRGNLLQQTVKLDGDDFRREGLQRRLGCIGDTLPAFGVAIEGDDRFRKSMRVGLCDDGVLAVAQA